MRKPLRAWNREQLLGYASTDYEERIAGMLGYAVTDLGHYLIEAFHLSARCE